MRRRKRVLTLRPKNTTQRIYKRGGRRRNASRRRWNRRHVTGLYDWTATNSSDNDERFVLLLLRGLYTPFPRYPSSSSSSSSLLLFFFLFIALFILFFFHAQLIDALESEWASGLQVRRSCTKAFIVCRRSSSAALIIIHQCDVEQHKSSSDESVGGLDVVAFQQLAPRSLSLLIEQPLQWQPPPFF